MLLLFKGTQTESYFSRIIVVVISKLSKLFNDVLIATIIDVYLSSSEVGYVRARFSSLCIITLSHNEY